MANLIGSRSVFPAAIDDILELYSLPASKKTDALRYQELIMKSSLTPEEFIELYNLINELQSYIIDVEKWNKFGDILINMQNFFKDETEGYILQKQNEFQEEIDKFTYIGVYSSSNQYYQNNIVEFFDGATTQLFLALQDTLGNEPTNSAYWRKLTLQGPEGAQGADGVGLSFKGEWDSGTTYDKDNGVQYGGILFASLIDGNFDNTPNLSGDTEYWSRVLNVNIKVARQVGVRTVVNNTDTVNFMTGDISSYNPTTDSIEVFMNSVRLTKGLDYTIGAVNETIEKTSGTWSASSEVPAIFEIIVTKNILDNNMVFADGNYIMDNTIGVEKLKDFSFITVSETKPINAILWCEEII